MISATRTADPSALERRHFEFFTKSTPFYGHATATTMDANILNTIYSDKKEIVWQDQSCCLCSAFNNSSGMAFLKSQKEIQVGIVSAREKLELIDTQLFGNELDPWMGTITCTSFDKWCACGKSCYCDNDMPLEVSPLWPLVALVPSKVLPFRTHHAFTLVELMTDILSY